MTRTTIVIAATLALAATLPMTPAQAAAARTFVSAAGSDSNNCTNVATPCRHLATAYAATTPNGEIYVLDPANYGALTITGPVSIEGHGWASIAPVTNSAAITINANPGDKINIVGVVLDGTAIANTTGILFEGGGSLTVRDSVIRNFTDDGIDFAPNSSNPIQFFISNTLVSDNGSTGVNISPSGSGTTTGVLDHVQIENNATDGLTVISNSTQTINVTISDSVSAKNGNDGIAADSFGGTTVQVMVRNCTVANNTAYGLEANSTAPGATLRVTRSTVTGNGIAWSAAVSGVVSSYADNNIDGNSSGDTPPPPAIGYK
jgi:Right handed beta helix region